MLGVSITHGKKGVKKSKYFNDRVMIGQSYFTYHKKKLLYFKYGLLIEATISNFEFCNELKFSHIEFIFFYLLLTFL